MDELLEQKLTAIYVYAPKYMRDYLIADLCEKYGTEWVAEHIVKMGFDKIPTEN